MQTDDNGLDVLECKVRSTLPFALNTTLSRTDQRATQKDLDMLKDEDEVSFIVIDGGHGRIRGAGRWDAGAQRAMRALTGAIQALNGARALASAIRALASAIRALTGAIRVLGLSGEGKSSGTERKPGARVPTGCVDRTRVPCRSGHNRRRRGGR